MPTPINISASRGAAILGLSNWSTPVNIWLKIMESREPGFCEKHKYVIPEFEYTPAMRWGHAFESAIIELAENTTGKMIGAREQFFKNNHANYNFITCHIDGCYSDYPEKYILHEGKTTSLFYYKNNFGKPGTDQVPIEYQIQCQHQMICTGAEKVILSVLVFPRRVEEWEAMGITANVEKYDLHNLVGKNHLLKLSADKTSWFHSILSYNWASILDEMGYFHQYEIIANPELHKLMIAKYTEWWNKHVIGRTAPEPKTYDDIKSLMREPVGTIMADDRIERLVSEYKHIGTEIGQSGSLSKRRDELKVEIIKFMSESGYIEDDDSHDRWILRDSTGKKIAQYSRTEKGMMFR